MASNAINVNKYLSGGIRKQFNAASHQMMSNIATSTKSYSSDKTAAETVVAQTLATLHKDHQRAISAGKSLAQAKDTLKQLSHASSIFSPSSRKLRRTVKTFIRAEKYWADICQQQLEQSKTMYEQAVTFSRNIKAKDASRLKIAKQFVDTMSKLEKRL